MCVNLTTFTSIRLWRWYQNISRDWVIISREKAMALIWWFLFCFFFLNWHLHHHSRVGNPTSALVFKTIIITFSLFPGFQLSKHHHLHHLCSKNCSACYNHAVIMLSPFCDNWDSGAFHGLKTQLYNCHHKYDNDHQQHKFCNKHQHYDNHLHCHNTSNIESL